MVPSAKRHFGFNGYGVSEAFFFRVKRRAYKALLINNYGVETAFPLGVPILVFNDCR